MISRIIYKMINYFGNDVKRINHALKVYNHANLIASLEQVSKEEKIIIEIAGILHDIGIKAAEEKYNSSAGKYQEIEGPNIVFDMLKDMDINKSIIERVCYIIGNHHSYQKIDGIDFQIMVEADFLVNVDEDQMNLSNIKSIQNKYFKTQTGSELLKTMFL